MPEDNNDMGISYKVHNQEFYSLNDERKELGKLYEVCVLYPGRVIAFYTKLNSLYLRYHPYFTKEENRNEIKDCLSRAKKLLDDNSYKKDLEQYFQGQPATGKMLTHESKIREKLERVFELMTQELVNTEMLPKPEEKIDDEDEY